MGCAGNVAVGIHTCIYIDTQSSRLLHTAHTQARGAETDGEPTSKASWGRGRSVSVWATAAA